jgi:hypothetical protein
MVEGGGGSEGGRKGTGLGMEELRIGIVVIVFWESGRGGSAGRVEEVFGCLMGLGGLKAISSSEDVILISSSGSGTSFCFGFGFFGFDLVFEFEFDFELVSPLVMTLALTLGEVVVDFVALVFLDRIFARSASESPYSYLPLSKPESNMDALWIVEFEGPPAPIEIDASMILLEASAPL